MALIHSMGDIQYAAAAAAAVRAGASVGRRQFVHAISAAGGTG